MDDEQCPKCGAIFPADRAWANRTVAGLLVSQSLQDLDSRVRCPRCKTVFEATRYRFFWVVTPRAMRIAVWLFLAVMFVAGVYFLVIDAP